jgi:hypothetical protein
VDAAYDQSSKKQGVRSLCREHGYRTVPTRKRKAANGNSHDATSAGGVEDWVHLTANIQTGRELHDSLRDLAAKIEALLLWLTFIRKVAQSALPPEYIVDQPDLSPQVDEIAEEAEAIRARTAMMAAQRDRRKDN